MAATKIIATDFNSSLETLSKRREPVFSSQDNSLTGVAGQIQRKYCQKQLEHSLLSTTARRMVTLSFSMAVKYLLYPRDLRFPAGMLSLRRKRALRDGISVISVVCNCTCVIAHVKLEINLKTIFSNTQHFAVYVRCMPSRRLLRLDTPLAKTTPINSGL